MFKIRIINGKRSGKIIDFLEGAQLFNSEQDYLLEDESLEFIAELPEDHINLCLSLHELEIPYSNKESSFSGGFIYHWRPYTSGFYKECFFHNFCGLAELALIERDINNFENIIFFKQLKPIEVLAKKISADRVTAMLDFLSKNDARDLAAAARITRINSGHKEGNKTPAFILDQIENNVIFIKSIIQTIIKKPLVNLSKKNEITPITQDTLIDEDSINWIIQNPYTLYPVEYTSPHLIEHENNHYNSDIILESKILTNTNIYENQVLHGFVLSMIQSTQSILTKFLENSKNHKISIEVSEYISLFSKLSKFRNILNQSSISKCRKLLGDLRELQKILDIKIPVSKKILTIPSFTPKAKQNKNYQLIFHRMITWFKYGNPDWSLQNELNSIKDIPKLFEYYTFCLIKHHLYSYLKDNQGALATPFLNVNDIKFTFELNTNYKIELYYEPRIWQQERDDAALEELFNSEAWSVGYSEYKNDISLPSNNKNLKIYNRSKKKNQPIDRAPHRCPDILIKLTNGIDSQYLIMDAKYTTPDKAWLQYLPDMTMKYIHGIHSRDGINRTIALFVINPSEKCHSRHYHRDAYNIHGTNTIFPSLINNSINIFEAHLDSDIKRDLYKALEHMYNRLEFYSEKST